MEGLAAKSIYTKYGDARAASGATRWCIRVWNIQGTLLIALLGCGELLEVPANLVSNLEHLHRRFSSVRSTLYRRACELFSVLCILQFLQSGRNELRALTCSGSCRNNRLAFCTGSSALLGDQFVVQIFCGIPVSCRELRCSPQSANKLRRFEIDCFLKFQNFLKTFRKCSNCRHKFPL